MPARPKCSARRKKLEHEAQELQRKDREIAWRDARLRRWEFGVKTEAMSSQQRALFAETLVEDEAGLQAQVAALQASLPATPEAPKPAARQPRPRPCSNRSWRRTSSA